MGSGRAEALALGPTGCRGPCMGVGPMETVGPAHPLSLCPAPTSLSGLGVQNPSGILRAPPYPAFYSTPGIAPGGGRGRWHHPRCVDAERGQEAPWQGPADPAAPTRVCTGGCRSAEGAACQPLPLLPVLAPAPAHGHPR